MKSVGSFSSGSNDDSLRSRNARRIDSFSGPSSSSSTAGGGLEDIPFATAVTVDEYENSASFGRNAKMGGKGKGGSSASSSAGTLATAPSATTDNSPLETPSGKQAKDWPAGLIDAVVKTFNRPPDEVEGRRLLSSHGWPSGLQETFFRSCRKIPIRFFIVDDSGSMSTNDGRKIVRQGPGKAKMVSCTRWSELTDALSFHIDLAEAVKAPTEFRLLNGADPVIVGMGDDNGEGLAFAKEVIAEGPAGQTPLCAHIHCVVKAITKMAPALRANGQKAAVIIATDGESTDGNVSEAMKPLQKLPVWVVIRLATDTPDVVRYWDQIDKELELEMDVLDDLVQDARQVDRVNPWLRYGDELHRMREFGASFKEMDLIDGRALSLSLSLSRSLSLSHRGSLLRAWTVFPVNTHAAHNTHSLTHSPSSLFSWKMTDLPIPTLLPNRRNLTGRRTDEINGAANPRLPAAPPRS